MRCRTCGGVRTSYEEKVTDVNIAVALMEVAPLATGDKSRHQHRQRSLPSRMVRAPSQSAADHRAGVPPHRRSGELKALLPSAFTISETKLRQSQLPLVVQDTVTGAKYVRPTYWQ